MEHYYEMFVKNHRDVLIQKVTSVMPITNALKDKRIIHQETYSSIQRASTCTDKMTLLFDALNNANATSSFYNALKTVMPDLVEKCELQDAQFVNAHSPFLIQKVSNVMAIADKLKAAKIIHEETYAKIWAASPSQEQMRELFQALSTDKAKSAFYNFLRDVDDNLVENLKQQGIQQEIPGSAQTSPEVLEFKSHAQKAEDKQIPHWNKSSKKHEAKIEELLKETDKEKVGNLYFYKDEKYMISSEGNGTQVYIGLTEDGIEVAIKIIMKNPKNNKDFENELRHLQKLESKYIVRYVTFTQCKYFYYLANQLCECDLMDYMKKRKHNEAVLKKIVKEMLLGLQVLHSAEVIHRDLKPRNVLIGLIGDEETTRLADFGISRKLEDGKTTVYTDRAGTQGWEATEIVKESGKGRYKKSSDIQVAGMLTYYILSDGKHPFGDVVGRELKILNGEYTLKDVQDTNAKDLIEWMLNKDQEKRPTIDKVLDHPYFWDDRRIREVLHNLGNKDEVQKYKTYKNNKDLYEAIQKHSKEKSFTDWKLKVHEKWGKIPEALPNNLLGLLRYLRNELGHEEKRFYELQMIDEFPDFLISLHRLAADMNWQ